LQQNILKFKSFRNLQAEPIALDQCIKKIFEAFIDITQKNFIKIP